jgi:hypothetical protein
MIWSQMLNQRPENEDTDRMILGSSSTKNSSDHYNTNNSNNNNLHSQSPTSSRASSSWKETLERILKPKKFKKNSSIQSKTIINHSNDSNTSDSSIISRQNGKHVHWIDNDKIRLNFCHYFVDNLKLFIQNIIDNQYEEIYLKNCQTALDELDKLIDCSQLKQAFNYSIELANKNEKHKLLQQQTYIAHLISHTVLSS